MKAQAEAIGKEFVDLPNMRCGRLLAID